MSSLSNSNDDRSIKSQEKVSEMTQRGTLETVVPLAPASDSVGSGCFLNAQLNGIKISDRRYSDLLKDGMIIWRFYHHERDCDHGFVVFQTKPDETFMVHIVGEKQSDGKWQIFVEIKKSEWRQGPDERQESNQTAEALKKHIEDLQKNFNTYKLGVNDCRHFSQKIEDFLKID
jgi:hypothetical protein